MKLYTYINQYQLLIGKQGNIDCAKQDSQLIIYNPNLVVAIDNVWNVEAPETLY